MASCAFAGFDGRGSRCWRHRQCLRKARSRASPCRGRIACSSSPAKCRSRRPEGLLPTERQNYGDHGRVGKFHDFVTRYGLDPAVAVIATGDRPPPTSRSASCSRCSTRPSNGTKRPAPRLGRLLGYQGRFPQGRIAKRAGEERRSVGRRAKIKHVPLGIDLAADQPNNDRAKRYGIAADATVTVILYSNQPSAAAGTSPAPSRSTMPPSPRFRKR